ncbi:hypothetical protein CEXT_774291 [Caerostris extrusa]|uniref:Uncharacterized protein n=1 Tax=Caerostris extrusa TaxID=172846 RepID=A0AAV4NLC3_CAEEX|nr:hypothetical protein CEXT_774291 [Caerostris extrusa]
MVPFTLVYCRFEQHLKIVGSNFPEAQGIEATYLGTEDISKQDIAKVYVPFSTEYVKEKYMMHVLSSKPLNTIDDQVFPVRNREKLSMECNFPESLGMDVSSSGSGHVRVYIYVSFEPLNVLEKYVTH